MVLRVQRVDEEFRIVLSQEAMEALHLSEGAEVQLLAVEPSAPVVQYASDEAAMSAYRATLPAFRAAFEELAK